MTANSNPGQTWNPWPAAIIVFFCLAIAAMVGFVAFCSLHPTELVSQDYYEQELRFQQQIDRVERGRQVASLASVEYVAHSHIIKIMVPPAEPGTDLSGRVVLYRPSAASMDQVIALTPSADGVQTIDTTRLPGGLWKVKVTWSANGKDYFVDRDVKI